MPSQTKYETIPLSEAHRWLRERKGRQISRQALHKAAREGWLPVARTIRIGGRRFRWVRKKDLTEYASRTLKNP